MALCWVQINGMENKFREIMVDFKGVDGICYYHFEHYFFSPLFQQYNVGQKVKVILNNYFCFFF